MKIDDFDYALPPELIAQEPTAERAASRLLVLDRTTGAMAHRVFGDLPALLRSGDLLVLNRSRVFPARLHGKRRHGGEAEILLVRRTGPDTWEALLRPGRRLRPGDVVQCRAGLKAIVLEGETGPDGQRSVRLEAAGDPEAALEEAGEVPLPPYIERPPRAEDRERYQTVYAREAGSVAAPTAGLHFTRPLLDTLAARGIEVTELVLHVGPGTFRPVKAKDVRDHRVAAEPYEIPPAAAAAIERARARGGRVIAVGTTAVRTLETAARTDGTVAAGQGQTDLVVVPGFDFRVVDGLVTNFHLPRSSLLLLVAAFAGRERILAAYQAAIAQRYRFYSYGDAMLIQ